MIRLLAIGGAALGALVIGLLLFLALMDIPAPTQKIEKVVPDARLPH